MAFQDLAVRLFSSHDALSSNFMNSLHFLTYLLTIPNSVPPTHFAYLDPRLLMSVLKNQPEYFVDNSNSVCPIRQHMILSPISSCSLLPIFPVWNIIWPCANSSCQKIENHWLASVLLHLHPISYQVDFSLNPVLFSW